jgi:hypothetical protein
MGTDVAGSGARQAATWIHMAIGEGEWLGLRLRLTPRGGPDHDRGETYPEGVAA